MHHRTSLWESNSPAFASFFQKKELWRIDFQSNFTLKAWNQSFTIAESGLTKILILRKLEHMIRRETEDSSLFRSDVALLNQYIYVWLSLLRIDSTEWPYTLHYFHFNSREVRSHTSKLHCCVRSDLFSIENNVGYGFANFYEYLKNTQMFSLSMDWNSIRNVS